MLPEHLKIEGGLRCHLDDSKRGGQICGIPMGVRVTHEPTGLVAFYSNERSQIKNRNVCVAMIEYGLAEIGWRDPSPESNP